MNPEQPSREQIEARITALLLGELPADEAALLRYTMAQDPALQKLHDELQATLALVREAAKHPGEPAVEKAAPLKLSAERREKLLAHFKTERTKATQGTQGTQAAQEPLFWLKRIEVPRLVPVLVAVAVIALLAAMLLPELSAAKRKTQKISVGMVKEREVPAELQSKTQSASDNDEKRKSAETLAQQPSPSAANTLAAAPVVATRRPEEPKLAPPPATPPTQIVLPQTESTAEGAAQRETTFDAAKLGVSSQQRAGSETGAPAVGGAYSQLIEGYANIPANSGASQLALNNRDQKQEAVKLPQGGQAEKQWVVPGQVVDSFSSVRSTGVVNAFAGAVGFGGTTPQMANGNAFAGSGGGGGGGGGGAAAATPMPAGTFPAQAVPPATAAAPAPLEVPAGAVLSDSAGEVATAETKGENAERRFITSGVQTHGAAGLAGNIYYRNLSQETEKENVSTLSGAPIAGNVAPPVTAPPVVSIPPAADTEYTVVSGDTLSKIARENGVTLKALEDANPGVEPKKLRPGKNLTIPASTASTTAARTPAAGNLTLAFAGGSYATGVAKDDIESLRYLDTNGQTQPSSGPANHFISRYAYVATNAIALNGGLQNTFNPGTSAITPDTAKALELPRGEFPTKAEQEETTAPTLDAEQLKKAQSYDDAKRDLEQKLETHKLFYSKLNAEKLDLSLPENSMVELTDPAEPNRNQTFWQRLTGRYESKARMKVENDVTDIPGLAANTPTYQGFDPYFVQTTFEVIQSPAVLSNVVAKLDLQTAWANKNGGQKLTESEAVAELKQRLDLHPVKNTKLIEIGVTSDNPNEAANIANAVAKAYKDYRFETRRQLAANGVAAQDEQFVQQEKEIQLAQAKAEQLGKELAPEQTAQAAEQADLPLRKPAPNTPLPQPEILTRENNFSTFSLNVSDVSFKFAEASLQNGKLPDTASIRSEEFINAFNYRDPEAAQGQPMAFASERVRYPFAHNRELLRFAIKTAAAGRQQGRALNLVLLLDISGSMERADRVAIIREALRVLATQLQPQDTVSVVTFSRTARLWADGVSGDKAGETLERVGEITPEGGTNLEEALRLAYETARRHYLAKGMNRVVLLTDGAANLGDVNPTNLKQKVEAQRKQGIALDCFGIGWEDYNDDLLEQLSSNGDGRYAFLNSPEDASKDFAAKLAGALQIAAADVKVQVEFNPQRVTSYRQIGYATHQLTKEQFRDNTVAAGQIAAQEAGNALYTIEVNPGGDGPIATVHVRYKVPGTDEYREHSWEVEYTGNAPALEQSSPAMRLAAVASAFSEWLAASPYAQEVTLDELLRYLSGVPEVYGADDRPKQLETMIREAKSLEGK